MPGLRILMDGNNTAYRANCVTELYTKRGERTSAIVGTLNITHSVMEKLADEYGLPVKEVIYAFDKGHSQRRKDLFPEYKHNRKKDQQDTEAAEENRLWMEEFIQQTNTLYENLCLFGVKCLRKDGWEGDDLIFGLSKALVERYPEDRVVIVSTDEDFHQLIDEYVDLYSPIKEILYTHANYEELMGIPREGFLTYKILKGDSSDGIGGIQGIGDKTAKSLVNTYGNIDGLLSPVNRDALMKSKRTAKILSAEGLRILDRNNQLINLKDYVDLTEVIDDIAEVLDEEPFVDTSQARNFLMKYQITSILTKWKTWIQTFEDCVDSWFESDSD